MFTYELKRELLRIARDSIAAALRVTPARTINAQRVSQELLQPGGAFVTIRMNHELRGCIGYMESFLPLAEVVADVSVKAALDDPRFPPLAVHEIDHAILEISVLSPMRQIHSREEIHVGEHGLVLELGTSKGVLLPQVAIEYGWNEEEFLNAVCRKAGLSKSAWKEPDARISVFSADVFDEEKVLREHPA